MAAPAAPSIAAVLALQRSAGNAATVRALRGSGSRPPGRGGLLQRDPLDAGAPSEAPPGGAPSPAPATAAPAPAAPLTDRYDAAVHEQRWGDAAVLLNGFSDPDIASRVTALSPADRGAMRPATPEWAHRVRTPLLDLDYRDAVAAGNWTQAAILLNGFNAGDIATRVGALSPAQHVELWVAAPDSATPVLAAIAAVDLDAAFKAAVRKANWAKAAEYVNGFSDPDIASHLTALTPAERAALRQATPEAPNRVRTALLELDYTDAVAAGNWAKAAEYLNGFNDADILARARALSPAQRASLRQATPAWASRVRSPLLDLDYTDAVAAGNWAKAAECLNGFNDADIATRIATLSPAQRQQLMAGARENTALGGGDRILAAVRTAGGTPAGAGEVFGTVAVVQTINSAAAPGGLYDSPITITFTPNASVCNCPDIGFVQTLRMVTTGTNSNRDIIPNQKDRLNANQEAVDRLPGRKFGWYGRDNAGAVQSNLTAGSCPPPVAAVLADQPSWNQPNLTWEFETSVIARSGPQANQVYSVTHWGFTVDSRNVLTALPVRKVDRTSAGFGTAVDAWNAQASGPAAGRSAPDQQTLPSFH